MMTEHSLMRWRPEEFEELIRDEVWQGKLASLPLMSELMDETGSRELRDWITAMVACLNTLSPQIGQREAVKLVALNGFYLGWMARERLQGADELEKMVRKQEPGDRSQEPE
jgi:hypothetical protein